jgi:hypothetical protein
MKSIGLAASIAGLVGAMGGTAAGAATATYQSQTVSGTLGFDTNVRLPQFDPFLGTLNSVTLGVFNQNVSLFQIENLRAGFKSLSSVAVLCGSSHDHADGRDLGPCG